MTDFDYDIFICHSGQHDEWADSFAANLRELGHKVVNDAEFRIPGMEWPEKLARAARNVHTALILMGADSYTKGWVKTEVNTFWQRRNAEGDAFKLIP
ncbi:MAG: toll/interleukin-1 receptor domain-containing protein, partial [Bacteroidota bacterium]